MLSYLHRYHAGCFADVHKHLTLMAILSYLQTKEKPFSVLDLYAGEGFYDLSSKESLKTQEHDKGIRALLKLKNQPKLSHEFTKFIAHLNRTSDKTNIYPGSPAIISQFLREQDSATFVELHARSYEKLHQHFANHPQIHLHERNALEALKSLVPFKEKRGLIFIDPSYEVKTEYVAVFNAFMQAYERFSHGVYAIWYPILEEAYHQKLLKKFKNADLPKVWISEWLPYPDLTKGMLGSGMILVNPPFQIDKLLSQTFSDLNQSAFKGGVFKRA